MEDHKRRYIRCVESSNRHDESSNMYDESSNIHVESSKMYEVLREMDINTNMITVKQRQ